MARRRRRHDTPLRTSKQDIVALKRAPHSPQTASAAFRLAYADDEFLTSDDTRGVRFQLEYLKPEFSLRERGIQSTVVLFGGARLMAATSCLDVLSGVWRRLAMLVSDCRES